MIISRGLKIIARRLPSQFSNQMIENQRQYLQNELALQRRLENLEHRHSQQSCFPYCHSLIISFQTKINQSIVPRRMILSLCLSTCRSFKTFATVRLPDLVSVSIILLSSSASNSPSLTITSSWIYAVFEPISQKVEIVYCVKWYESVPRLPHI